MLDCLKKGSEPGLHRQLKSRIPAMGACGHPGRSTMSDTRTRRLRPHALLGTGIMLASGMLLAAGNRWVGSFFTPLMWTGYIIAIDAVVAARTGASPLTTRRGEFLLMLPISIAGWYVFEGANLLLKSWSYVDLPEGAAARWLGYAWAYATITPAVLVTAALVDSLVGERFRDRRPLRLGRGVETAFFVAGILSFAAMLVFPSPWLCFLPWIGVLLWFEGMNDRLGIGSFGAAFRKGNYSLFVSLLVSGAVCGILWEAWNYRAITKWHYHVPYLPGVKLFEMPVLGYLGFPPFALECWLMYRLFRFLTPVRGDADALGATWSGPKPGEAP
jgi:hypothetical protein